MTTDSLITALAGLIGIGIGSIPFWIERKDRYRLELYKNDLEKRLEEFKKDLEIKYEVRIRAHQKAFYWVIKLSEAFHGLENEKIWEVTRQAKEWWDQECFYLDNDSAAKFIELTQRAPSFASERRESDRREYQKNTWKLLNETLRAIQSGIKTQRLAVLEMPKTQEDNG